MRLHEPIRYQLTKDASRVVRQGHPWVFRSHLSSAAQGFRSGQWLKLVDNENHTAGYGIYEPEGLIGIRVFKTGSTPPDRAWFEGQVNKALARRAQLKNFSNAFRALHGENDGLPGIVLDVYENTGVLQTYAPSLDHTGRFLSGLVRERLPLQSLVWKLPVKRKAAHKEDPVRLIFGPPPGNVRFREGKLTLTVSPFEGQKSGAFLDLRGLRKWIANQPLTGKRVLNLFCYSGTLGLAAETAGAKEIWNVDISPGALEFAEKYHAIDKRKHRYLKADVFRWINDLNEKELFDLIIVDPPQMASSSSQVAGALAIYRRMVKHLIKHVAGSGRMVVASCTSRMDRRSFENEMKQALGQSLRLMADLKPEDDHPVGFPEGDYLKILIFERRS